MRTPIVQRLQALDRAALRWLLSFRSGERARLCGAYGLGLASCAVGLGAYPPSESASVALSWLGIALCLYLAGLDRVEPPSLRAPEVERRRIDPAHASLLCPDSAALLAAGPAGEDPDDEPTLVHNPQRRPAP